MPSWIYWFIGLLIILIIIWLFWGRQKQPFIGLTRLYNNIATEKTDPAVNGIITDPIPSSMVTSNIIPSSLSSLSSLQSKSLVPVPVRTLSIGSHRTINKNNHSRLAKKTTQKRQKMQYVSLISKRSDFGSRGEYLCCYILEEIFHKPFYRVRPDFLKNPETGYNLEIDCYNEELKLGVEYNGETHNKWPNYTGQTFEDFTKQVRRDQFKVDQCDRAGVYLITVPSSVPESCMKKYIEYLLPWNVKAREKNNQT